MATKKYTFILLSTEKGGLIVHTTREDPTAIDRLYNPKVGFSIFTMKSKGYSLIYVENKPIEFKILNTVDNLTRLEANKMYNNFVDEYSGIMKIYSTKLKE